MGTGDVSLACARALVDELVSGGVREACICPGSRSTPLALALARHPNIRTHVQLDERAAGFFALGLAKARLRAVAVACTSGTAAAELFPAVIEASQSRVPVVVLTADRPPALRGTGANQTIDQVRLYGRYARAYVEPPVPASPADAVAWRDAARRAWRAAASRPLGPAHLNCPFDEPLVPEGEAFPQLAPDEPAPFDRPSLEPSAEDVERFAVEISGKRGAVAAGAIGWEPAAWCLALAERLGWPVLAEPLSGLRTSRSPHAIGESVVCRAPQALIGDPGWAARRRPEVVVQIGAAPTTRATQSLIASAERVVVVDHWHLDPDPRGVAALRLRIDPDELSRSLLSRPIAPAGEPIAFQHMVGTAMPSAEGLEAARVSPAPPEWTASWRTADDRARRSIDDLMDAWDEPFEPRVARDLAAAIPPGDARGSVLVVGNSTPVRDLDLAMAPRDRLRVLGNRGASGIDGLVATTLGAAAAGREPTYALLGDLSFLYDAGALLWSSHADVSAVLVVLDNGGGEIFSLLPQVGLPEHRELFVTPHGLDLELICAAAGAGHRRVERMRDFGAAVDGASDDGGVQVITVAVDAELNRRRRSQLRAGVAEALQDL
jgi:2-succinyl-5-enolpyruvyl-6-hydroxy-3-cyclohexene-1-carboxylate synthase